MGTAVYKITDGTTSVDLIRGPIHIKSGGWNPGYPSYKEGGLHRNSPREDGRRLVHANYEYVIESITVSISGASQDAVVATMRKLIKLFTQAKDYSASETRSDIAPVWLEKRASCETESTYALIISGRFDSVNTWFDAPFLQADANSVQDDVVVQIEHGHWCSSPPGEAELITEFSDFSVTNNRKGEWELLTDEAAANALSIPEHIFVTAAGNILVAADGHGYRSTDGGDTWAEIAGFAPNWMCEDDGAHIFTVVAGGVYRSTDEGVNWVQRAAAPVAGSYVQSITYSPVSDLLYCIDNANKVLYSSDEGANWSTLYDYSTDFFRPTAISYVDPKDGSGKGIIAIGIWPDPGAGADYAYLQTWVETGGVATLHTSYPVVYHPTTTAKFVEIYQPDASVTANSLWDKVFVSTSYRMYYCQCGVPLTNLTMIPYGFNDSTRINMCVDTTNNIGYATGNDYLFFSEDLTNWGAIRRTSTPYPNDAWYSVTFDPNTGRVLAGSKTEIYGLDRIPPVSPITVIDNKAFVTNYNSYSNIDYLFVYDAAPAPTYTDVTWENGTFGLLPAVPAVNDALYIGFLSTGDLEAVHQNIVFNLSTVATDVTVALEYYSGGGGWVATSATYTVDDTSGLTALGGNVISFGNQLTATVAVNGITGYWYRIRVTAVGAAPAPPQQTGRVYAIAWPYIKIDETVKGDIPALLSMIMTPKGESPTNWWAFGLRSKARGPFFSAYINCTEVQQNPGGITVEFGADTAAGTNLAYWPISGWAMCSINAQAQKPEVTIAIDGTLSPQYQGIYHVFLRCRDIYGGIGIPEISEPPSGNISMTMLIGQSSPAWTSETRYIDRSAFRTILDFGRLSIPKTNDSITFIISIGAETDNRIIHIYDLILMPMDEWGAIVSDSAGGRYTSVRSGYRLSVGDAFTTIPWRSAEKILNDSMDTFTRWINDANGTPILQTEKEQTLWTLSSTYYAYPFTDNSGVDNKAYGYTSSAQYPLYIYIREGDVVYNITDGSFGVVTSVTATSVYATLMGGTDNDFDNGDSIIVMTKALEFNSSVLYSIELYTNSRYLLTAGSG